MTIPIATTTVTIRRPADDPTVDAYDADTGPPSVVATGVRAHLSGVGADESAVGTSQTFTATLLADPCDLRHQDSVIDAAGAEWTVGAVTVVVDPDRYGPETDSHVKADVSRVSGIA